VKWLHKIVIFFVGGLFIFSGLIKLNDPIGTQIKLEEYFEVFAEDFKKEVPPAADSSQENSLPTKEDTTLSKLFIGLIPYALIFSVLLSALEVIWGINLLTGYRIRFTLWMLLLMILFFTFLTYYSWAYNKVTDCGCFGDAIKLSPKESFIKDILLTILIGFLFFQQKKLPALASPKVGLSANIIATLGAFGLGMYAIYFLPPIDFLPYKIGNNIPQLMQPSEKLEYKHEYTFKNLQTGQEEVFEEWQADSSRYQFVENGYRQVLLNPKAQPKITDFRVWQGDADSTQACFEGNKVLVIVENIQKSNLQSFVEISKLAQESKGSNLEIWLLSASGTAQIDALRHEYQLAIPYFSVDATVLKTMVRANPGVILLQNGTVKGKWPHSRLPSLADLQALL
jgi:uncharacterized membrane protein YphA (DoxX/SURF4 family)